MQWLKGTLLCLLVVLQAVEYIQPSVCLEEVNGQVFIPSDFPEYYNPSTAFAKSSGTNADLIESPNNQLYITTITVPAECDGNVTSIEFCYPATRNDIGGGSISFIFHLLTRENSNFQSNRHERISPTIALANCHDPGGNPSSRVTCCNRQDLEFTLSVGSISIGIQTGSDALLIATFPPNDQIDRFIERANILDGDGAFTLSSSAQNNFPLLRLIVDIAGPAPTTSTGANVATSVPPPAEVTTSVPNQISSTPMNVAGTSMTTPISSTAAADPETTTVTPSSSTPNVMSATPVATSGAGPTIITPTTSMTSDSGETTTTVPGNMVDQSTVDSDMKPSSAILTSTFTTDRPSTAMTNVIASSAIVIPTPTTDRPSTTMTNVIPTAGAVGGGSSAAGTIGGAVGGVIVAVLLAVVLVVLVAVIILRRRRNSKQGEQAIDNAVYEGVEEEGPSFNRPLYIKNEYAGIGPATAMDSGDKDLEVPHEYADLGAAYEIPLESLKGTLPPPDLPDPVSNYKEEDVYMVPATDENSLYAQLGDILALNISRSWVKLGSQLGSGQFGVVYRGVLDSSEGEEVEVAVKTLKEGSGEEDRVKFLQEAAIMGQFKHHNVVTMHGVVTQGEPVLLVLELLLKGDLRDYLIHMRSGEEGGDVSVDDHTLLSYCRQVASGMAYLSNKAFVHRDLAARNILVSDDDICKIADFGMSRDLANENYYVSHGGKIPVKWTAPEALHYKKYSTASDVWSYGILMYEIWSVGYKPYQNQANNVVLRLVGTGYRLPPPPGCPRALYNIMVACWHPEPSQRPSFPEVTRQLSLPDPKLLKWSEEDKCVHPEAAKLGADLKCGQELYKDLQTRYSQKQ